MVKISLDEYKRNIGQKINEVRERLVIPGQRDEKEGLLFSTSRIAASMENLYYRLGVGVHDPVDSIYASFAQNPGLNDVTNVYGVSVIDLSIGATIQSILPYLCVERPMTNPKDMFHYQSLVAVNSKGGFSAGGSVVDPFLPIGTSMNISLTGTQATLTAAGGSGGANGTLTYSVPIARKSVLLYAKATSAADNTYVLIGQDFKGDGTIYLNTGAHLASATVAYDTGIVTLTAIAANYTVRGIISVDRSSEADAANTLVVKPSETEIFVESQPNRIIFENSIENQAYMNKLAAQNQAFGISLDYGQTAIQQLLSAYVQYLNVRAVNQVMAAAALDTSGNTPALDASTYYGTAGFTTFAPTKNDKIEKFFINLNTHLLQRCGKGITAYVTGLEGANIMANLSAGLFQPTPAFQQNLDGLVGFFKGVPVVRHQAASSQESSGYAYYYAVAKTPDGKSGPVAYGDFLPLYSTKPAANYQNPTEYAQAFFSQDVMATLISQMATYGAIKFSS